MRQERVGREDMKKDSMIQMFDSLPDSDYF